MKTAYLHEHATSKETTLQRCSKGVDCWTLNALELGQRSLNLAIQGKALLSLRLQVQCGASLCNLI